MSETLALGGVLLVLAYATLGFVVGCRVASALAWYWRGDRNRRWGGDIYGGGLLQCPSTEQWVGAASLGFMAALIWPLVAVGAAFRGSLFPEPASARMERQTARVAELEKENQELDRALGRGA